MRILFLTPDLSGYSSAFYQRDFYNAVRDQHEVVPYGPGFQQYDPTDTIDDVLTKTEGVPDVICLGHNWLTDNSDKPLSRSENLDLSGTEIPAVLVLNKVYSKFQEKVDFATEHGIELVFTHHHHARKWTDRFRPEFVFWPFAVNSERFKDYGEPDRYDLTFSGILRNPNPSVPQSDIRKRIQNHLFYTVGNVWVYPRPEFRDLNLFWSVRPTSTAGHVLYRLLGRTGHLPEDDYKKLLNRSKIGLNTLSPMDLVGTRYYETMASKALVFCQDSSIYTDYDLFEPGTHCVTFADDLSDFDEKLSYYLEDEDECQRIAARGHEHVLEHHTWTDRVDSFTETVRERLL